MKHKILLLLFLFSLLPSWGWGKEAEVKETIDFADPEYNGGYTIEKNGTYTFKGTYSGTPTQDIGNNLKAVINVKADLDLEVTIILSEVKIDLSGFGECPLSAKDAKMVNLKLKGENTLIADNCPGIWAPERTNCGIIINELNGFKGSLEAIGDKDSGAGTPGIGGFYNNSDKKGYIIINGGNINAKGIAGAAIGGVLNSSGGIIIINGGNITATSEAHGAGIGSGENGSESEITINGGTIFASSRGSGVGIGTGFRGSKSKITITGGTVTAISTDGAGIGSGESSSGSNITITGGTVTATSESGAGIGDGKGGSGSTFSTGENGTAFINASSISDPSYKDNAIGLIFDGDEGAIYGVSYTLTANATIESKKTLTIKDNQTLVIKDGVTLTNEGTINNNGKILIIGSGEINGSVSSNQPIKGFEVTYKLNYEDSPADHIEYAKSGDPLPEYVVKRDYYTFAGWFTESDGGNQVETIKGATTVYAHWEPIPLDSKTKLEINKTYAKDIKIEIIADIFILNIDKVGGIKSIELISTTNNLFKELSLEYSNPDDTSKGTLKGNPIDIGTTDISIKFTANNGATTNVSFRCTVAKADLTIAPGEPITKVYDGNNTVTTPNALKLWNVDSNDEASGDDVYLDSYTLTYDNKNVGTEKKITLPREYTLAGEKKDFYNLTDLAKDFALKGTITQAPLTITPKPNQKLFEGEAPAYEVLGAVNNETPKFTGSLGVESGKVVINSLALTTEFAQNYSLSLTPDIPITIINNETAKSLVQLNGTTNANGAYIDEVTVTAPEGFLIALESSSLKSSLVYTKSFTWNQKGTYDLNYKLKRISDGEESNDFSMEITVVESHYIPDNGGNDNNDSSITEYNIEIPEVEGISIDEGFGDHWIKDWKDFSFIITVKEGYVENSDPEVTIKGYDFEFDALTDTTYECRIDHIFKNAKVTITGIVKDPPATANNAIKAPEESWKIMNGVAYITVAKPTVFAVVDMKGNIISTNKLAPGETPIYNLPRAKPIVFWFDKERAVKVIIK